MDVEGRCAGERSGAMSDTLADKRADLAGGLHLRDRGASGRGVTVWPSVLKKMCAARDIHVLE